MLQINKAKKLYIILFFIFVGCNSTEDRVKGLVQNEGFVPNEETAIKIAEVILYPIYGKSIKNQKPFKVTLIDNKIWVIEGSLKEDTVGGTFYIEIEKENCTILNVSHGK